MFVNDFDSDWYFEQNDDVANSGLDLYQHYQTYGKRENRNPKMPEWFSNALESEGWLRQEFEEFKNSLNTKQELYRLKVVNTPFIPNSHSVYKQILRLFSHLNQDIYVVLYTSKNVKFQLPQPFVKKNLVLIVLDKGNFLTLNTQIIGSFFSIKTLFSGDKIKILKIKHRMNKNT